MNDADELRRRAIELAEDASGVENVNMTVLSMTKIPEAHGLKIEIYSSEETYADLLMTICAGAAYIMKDGDKPAEMYFIFIRMLMHLLEDLAKEMISEARVRKWARERRLPIDFESLFGEGAGIGE